MLSRAFFLSELTDLGVQVEETTIGELLANLCVDTVVRLVDEYGGNVEYHLRGNRGTIAPWISLRPTDSEEYNVYTIYIVLHSATRKITNIDIVHYSATGQQEVRLSASQNGLYVKCLVRACDTSWEVDSVVAYQVSSGAITAT